MWGTQFRPNSSIQPQPLSLRIVIKIRPQPPLDLTQRPSLTLAVILRLIAIDLANTEIPRLRMPEVNPADARTRPHCVRLRNHDAGLLLYIHQLPDGALLRMVGARGIPRSRTNATILFLD